LTPEGDIGQDLILQRQSQFQPLSKHSFWADDNVCY
jgi:hypothetical protein